MMPNLSEKEQEEVLSSFLELVEPGKQMKLPLPVVDEEETRSCVCENPSGRERMEDDIVWRKVPSPQLYASEDARWFDHERDMKDFSGGWEGMQKKKAEAEGGQFMEILWHRYSKILRAWKPIMFEIRLRNPCSFL